MKTTLTIEQSQKLIDLGVDAKLASEHHVGRWEHYSNGSYPDPDSVSPLFSLSDLFSILPKEIDGYHLNIEAVPKGYNVAYFLWGEDAPWSGMIMDSKCKRYAPELIDALNSLLIWCLTEKKST